MTLASISFIGAAAEIFVQPGNSIQNPINNADSGDVIIVKPGTYTENVRITTDNLTIKSESIGHRLRSYFRFPLLFFESDPIISYSNHSSLNLFLFTCGSNACLLYTSPSPRDRT